MKTYLILLLLQNVIISRVINLEPGQSCPTGFIQKQDTCYSQSSNYWLVFQNKLQEDFASIANTQALTPTDSHRMVITAYERDVRAVGGVKNGINNLPIYLQFVSQEQTQTVLTPTATGIETMNLKTNTTYTFNTNALGKLILSVPLESNSDPKEIRDMASPPSQFPPISKIKHIGEPPLLKCRFSYMNEGQWYIVPFDIDAIESLSKISGDTLMSSPHIAPSVQKSDADSAAEAIRSLMGSSLQARMEESTELVPGGNRDASWNDPSVSNQQIDRLTGRPNSNHQQVFAGQHQWENQRFASQQQLVMQKPQPQASPFARLSKRTLPLLKRRKEQHYDPESNMIHHLHIHTERKIHKRDKYSEQQYLFTRKINSLAMDIQHMHLDFRNGCIKLNKHDSVESIDRHILYHHNQIRLTHSKSLLQRRSSGEAVKNGFKAAVNSVENIGKSIGRGIKNIGKSTGKLIEDVFTKPQNILKDTGKLFTTVGQSLVNITGSIVCATISAPTDILHSVGQSDLVFFKPLNDFTGALEAYIVTPLKKMVKFIVRTVSQVYAIIGGILAKLAMLPIFLFELIKALFNWDAILRTTTFLNHHLTNMGPFGRMAVARQFERIFQTVDNITTIATAAPQSIDEKMRKQGVSPDIDMQTALNPKNKNGNSSDSLMENEAVVGNEKDGHKVEFSEYQGKEGGVQSSYVRDMYPNFKEPMKSVQPSSSDQSLVAEIVGILTSAFSESKIDFKDMGQSFSQINAGLAAKSKSKGGMGLQFTDILDFIRKTMGVMLRGLLRLCVIIVSKVTELLIQLFHSIMNHHIDIPVISWIYEDIITKGTQKLTFMSIIALMAAVPVTVMIQATRNTVDSGAKDFLSKSDLQVLLSVEDPTNYVSVWHKSTGGSMQSAFDPDQDKIDPGLERKRNLLSQMIGSVFAECHLFNSLIGATDIISQNTILYMLRAPFQYAMVMSKYPHEWYFYGLEPVSEIKSGTMTVEVEIFRFFPWFLDLVPLAFGFAPYGNALSPWGIIKNGVSLLAQVVAISLVLVDDLEDHKIGTARSMKYGFDIFLKCFANMANTIGDALKSFDNPEVTAVGEVINLASSAGHIIRLGGDIVDNGIYSV